MPLAAIPTSWVHQWLKPLWVMLAAWKATIDAFLLGGNAAGVEADAVVSSNLTGYVYANGTLGVGATLTAGSNGAFATQDGVAAVLNNYYLVTGQSTPAQNGLYKLTVLGDGSTKAVLTRAISFDQTGEMLQGALFFIRTGTVNVNTAWRYTGIDNPTVGTTDLTFARDPGVVTTNTSQTITALKSFSTLMLAVWNAGATFVTKFATNATATRTVTFPDADATMAQAGVASGGAAPTGILDLASPVFSGTGQASSGQAITTTDNQTMTLNQCAGMWFVSATHGPYLIASNTAVTGAPAVLTILGTAPTTDAGAYKIVRTLVASHTHLQT